MRETDKLFNKSKPQFKLRQQVIEHIFGTIKHYMGNVQFNLRGMQNVEAEVSLLFLAYNLKRASNILGFREFMAKLKERTRFFRVLYTIFHDF